MKTYFFKKSDFIKILKLNRIIFYEDLYNISNKKKLVTKKETAKLLGLSLKKAQILIKKLVNKKNLKIAYFVFGSEFKKHHGLREFKNKSICFNYLFYKKDIMKIKDDFLSLNNLTEIDLSTIKKEYNLNLRNYQKLYKFKFFKRRKGNSMELVDCIKLTELNNFFKKHLKINLNEKIINKKKLITLEGILEKLQKLGYSNVSATAVLSKYKKLNIIKFAGNHFTNKKNIKENSRKVEKYFFSDFEKKLLTHLVQNYSKLINDYDPKKKLLLNNNKSFLKNKNIITDEDIIKILKINTGDRKIDQRLVRSLRDFYGLSFHCYIRNMGLPSYGTKKDTLNDFINLYGYFYTSKVPNLISHKIISKNFKQLNFYKFFKNKKIKSKFFYYKPGEGNITFLAPTETYLKIIQDSGYFKKGFTPQFKSKIKKSLIDTEKYLK